MRVPAYLRALSIGFACAAPFTALCASAVLTRSLPVNNPPPPSAPATTTPLPDFGADRFTVSAWIRTTRGGTVLAKAPQSGAWQPQGKALFVRDGRVCYDVGWVGCVSGSTMVADDRWHHIAITGPNDYALYVDGKLDVRQSMQVQADDPNHVLRIGYTSSDFPTPQTGWDGRLRDIRVYARSLNEREIATIASAQDQHATDRGLVARWPLTRDTRDVVRGSLATPNGPVRFDGAALTLDGSTSLELKGYSTHRALAQPDAYNYAQVANAIRALGRVRGRAYGATGYLKQLNTLQSASRRSDAQQQAHTLRYNALVRDNPLLGCDKLLFVRRKTYQSSHYYTEFIDGCKYYGGNLCVLNLRTHKVKELVPSMRQGIFGRFDLSFDARRVVFDYKAAPDQGFRIFEVGVDGSGLRQLTFPPADEQQLAHRYRTVGTPSGIPYLSGTDDMHPCYLPDGGIAFVTTRCQKGILCDDPDVLTTTTLYRMDSDGHNMSPLSFNSVSESTPSVTQDGRILYTRWEYVDKGASACKCIWSMNPDGTDSSEVYKNNIAHPTTAIDARDIPGSPNHYVMVGAPHMPLGVGSIIRLDTHQSLRTTAVMTKLTPEIDTYDESGYRHLRNGQWVFDYRGPLFREPYPLSDQFFLVTYNPDQPHNSPAGYALYMLDAFGNRVPIYRDPNYSCWEPYPLRPRKRPVVKPSIAHNTTGSGQATLALYDVYAGLTGVERGRVKYLRIMEDCPRPWAARRYWSGDDNPASQEHVAVSKWGHLAVKINHGVVPVQPDGSAYFTVPADRNIYFQALDENYMELQRMRTFVNVRPGEVRGCVGCHEEKRTTPSIGARAVALQSPPVHPVAQPGEVVPRTIDYATDVQPILDRHCVACHSGPQPKAGLDFSGEMTTLFNRSYETIIDKQLMGRNIDEIGPFGGKHANIEAIEPLKLGSLTSKLVAMAQKEHGGAKLPREEMIRLVTWVDANAPYYGTYDGRRNLKYRDMPDFRPKPKEGAQCASWSGPYHFSTGVSHPFICSDNGNGRVYVVSAQGQIQWEYPAEFGQDVWKLPNGNYLFSHLHGVKQVSPAYKVVWQYDSPSGVEVHSCQPLPDGGVMVCENGTRRILELDHEGTIRKQITVECGTPTTHMQFRIARKLSNGHYLIACVGEHLVRELDGDGKVLRVIPVEGDVFVAIRLPNGNTLIGAGDGHKVVEVDERDRVVWSISENELRGHPLRFVAGLQRLPNGNTVVCNWGGHGHIAEQPLVFEVTPDKRVVWEVDDYGQFRTISNIMLLDHPGAPLR